MPALLLFGDTTRSTALRHEIPLEVIDDLLFAEFDGKRFVLTWTFERDRVREACPDAEVLDFFSFGYRDLVKDGMSLLEAEREVVTRAVRKIGMTETMVPGDFRLESPIGSGRQEWLSASTTRRSSSAGGPRAPASSRVSAPRNGPPRRA